MKHTFSFASKKFPCLESDLEGVNWEAGIWGKKLADYLTEKLSAKGIEVADTYAEDWGWCIEIRHDGGFLHFVGCRNDAENSSENSFECFVEPSSPYVRKWFRKIDTSLVVGKAAQALNEILVADPDIHQLKQSND